MLLQIIPLNSTFDFIEPISREERLFLFKKKKKRKEISIASVRKLQLSRGRRDDILQDTRRFVEIPRRENGAIIAQEWPRYKLTT